MAYYERSDSYYDYDDYQSDSRRTSNSFSEEINGAKRKKSNWGGRGRGGRNRQYSRGGGNRNASPRNVNIDTPMFPEPKRSPPVARRVAQSPVDGRKRGRERNNSFRQPQNQPYFDIKEMPNFVEPEHLGPSWHWENYVRDCKNWQDKHKLAYYQSRCSALEFENQMLFEQINQLIQENIVFATERGRTPTVEVPEIPGVASKETQNSGNKNKVQERKQNGKGAAATGAKSGEKDGGTKGTKQQRKDELEQLYGKNSALIHGLETSLQLAFNSNCDTYKPEIYPAAPINSEVIEA